MAEKLASMKSPLAGPLALLAFVVLSCVGTASAQSASPTPTSEQATSPSPSVAASPTPVTVETPKKPELTEEQKKARRAERLRKYDTNHDGKLDAKEKAAMHADMAKSSPTP